MKWLGGLVILLCMAPLALAQFLPIIDEAITPPPLPTDTTINITLISSDSKEQITNSHVRSVLEQDETITSLHFIDEVLELPKKSGTWNLKLFVDRQETQGKDYYAEQQFSFSDREVKLHPVGSLLLRIQDEDKNYLSKAEVIATCSGPYLKESVSISDQFGIARFDYLPIGLCTISALKEGKVGFLTINMGKGELVENQIMLDQRVREDSRSIWLLLPLLVFIVGLILWFIYKRRAQEPEEKRESSNSGPHVAKILLPTLSENEQAVVKFLMETSPAYQNQIIHATSIPKTTMMRLLDSLTKKKIIEVERIGKAKKVRLTTWFQENEQK